MIFISAGHHNADPGAVGNGYKEADLTKELRDLTVKNLVALGGKFIVDNDYETLGQYLARITPGSGSVLCEFHFNAGPPTATGAETLIPANPNKNEKALAKEINDTLVSIMGIKDRGVKTEADSQHKRLAVMHDGAGMSILPEICFISNADDMKRYQANKEQLARKMAEILIKYDNLIS